MWPLNSELPANRVTEPADAGWSLNCTTFVSSSLKIILMVKVLLKGLTHKTVTLKLKLRMVMHVLKDIIIPFLVYGYAIEISMCEPEPTQLSPRMPATKPRARWVYFKTNTNQKDRK